VRKVHRGLVFVDPESGQRYRVDDPDLLLWVHCCEVDSFLTTARRAGLCLSGADADRYLAEQTRVAALVGLGPADVPTSRAALSGYFGEQRLTPQARGAARFVFWPPLPRVVELLTPARPAWLAVAGLAFALQPRWARRAYGLPGLPTTDLAASAAVAALRTGLLALPHDLRDGPHLKEARARLARAGGPARPLAALP
jgi:uncharacterized protein (DUF2236 family)